VTAIGYLARRRAFNKGKRGRFTKKGKLKPDSGMEKTYLSETGNRALENTRRAGCSETMIGHGEKGQHQKSPSLGGPGRTRHLIRRILQLMRRIEAASTPRQRGEGREHTSERGTQRWGFAKTT